jgi:hypothetical protein
MMVGQRGWVEGRKPRRQHFGIRMREHLPSVVLTVIFRDEIGNGT